MIHRCTLCDSNSLYLIYDSGKGVSVTSVSQIHSGRTQVYYCPSCCHVHTEGMVDTADYYSEDYNINLSHEDEDQLYEMNGERKVYRTEHQLNVLTSKIDIDSCTHVLDYGCAKSSMGSKLLELHKTLDLCLFDVSSAYETYWERMVDKGNCAVSETPSHWNNKFDLLTSFFSMEHIVDIRAALKHMISLIADGGKLYAIVPYVLGNIADLVVIDHVHHFTQESLKYVLEDTGFCDVQIDKDAHRGALVVIATKGKIQKTVVPVAAPHVETQIRKISEFWTGYANRVRQAELAVSGALAIFGAGFYGMFSYVCLIQRERVKMFLDNNTFLQNRKILNVPIVSPTEITPEVEGVLVGLNPTIARNVIAQLPSQITLQRSLFFFD